MPNFDFSDVDDLYQEIILDHYRSPRNQHELEEVDIETEGVNPFCGDEVYLRMKLNGGLVSAVSFKGSGCSISQASASMLTEAIKGKNLEEAESIYLLFREMMQGKETSDAELEALGEVESLAGVKKFPIRIKCAMLSWAALEEGIKKHRKRAAEGEGGATERAAF